MRVKAEGLAVLVNKGPKVGVLAPTRMPCQDAFPPRVVAPPTEALFQTARSDALGATVVQALSLTRLFVVLLRTRSAAKMLLGMTNRAVVTKILSFENFIGFLIWKI